MRFLIHDRDAKFRGTRLLAAAPNGAEHRADVTARHTRSVTPASGKRRSKEVSARADDGIRTRDPHLGKLAKETFPTCTNASDSARGPETLATHHCPLLPDDFHSLTGERRETKQVLASHLLHAHDRVERGRPGRREQIEDCLGAVHINLSRAELERPRRGEPDRARVPSRLSSAGPSPTATRLPWSISTVAPSTRNWRARP